jgi:hypothetical protein
MNTIAEILETKRGSWAETASQVLEGWCRVSTERLAKLASPRDKGRAAP